MKPVRTKKDNFSFPIEFDALKKQKLNNFFSKNERKHLNTKYPRLNLKNKLCCVSRHAVFKNELSKNRPLRALVRAVFFFFPMILKSAHESHFWPFSQIFQGYFFFFTPTFYPIFRFFTPTFFFTGTFFVFLNG